MTDSTASAGPESLLSPQQATVAPERPSYVYNLGCGDPSIDRLHAMFRQPGWRQVRVDIDPAARPDIRSSLTDLSQIADDSADAIWCSHALEHLERHDVPAALAEMVRILKTDGFAMITLPDLQRVAEVVAADRVDEVLYDSPAGPVSALDMLFGHGVQLRAGRRFMAHRGGFTAQSLGKALITAGFDTVKVKRGSDYDLWALCFLRDPAGLNGTVPDFR